MRVVIFSDLHANLDALETLLLREKNADLFLCLGDMVDYGPYNDECLERIFSLNNLICLRGNHEDMFIEGQPHPNCSEFARQFFNYSYPLFDKEKWVPILKNLPETLALDDYIPHSSGFIATHTVCDLYVYPNTPAFAFGGLNGKYFVGHSHYQFIINHPGLTIVNPGSLGQNRRQKNIASYLVWDTTHASFAFENFVYNTTRFQNAMKERGYPEVLWDYYTG